MVALEMFHVLAFNIQSGILFYIQYLATSLHDSVIFVNNILMLILFIKHLLPWIKSKISGIVF